MKQRGRSRPCRFSLNATPSSVGVGLPAEHARGADRGKAQCGLAALGQKEFNVFSSAKKDKISSTIIQQIKKAILTGEVKPGESLPPEKELIVQFGVSKHTLREALRSLEAMGFITIKRGAGGGPVVSEVDLETTRESFANFLHFKNVSIGDLSEVRKLVEPYLAAKAAESFTEEDIAQLMSFQRSCEELCAKGQTLVGAKAEVGFHVYLAQQTGNPVLLVILDFVNNLLTQLKEDIKPGQAFSENVLEAHQRIIDAIVAKDSEKAAKLMMQHIDDVEGELEDLKLNDAGFAAKSL